MRIGTLETEDLLLLGGVLLAIGPIVGYHDLIAFDAVRPLLLQTFLGVVVGDGVGLGIELGELIPTGDVLPVGKSAAPSL